MNEQLYYTGINETPNGRASAYFRTMKKAKARAKEQNDACEKAGLDRHYEVYSISPVGIPSKDIRD